MSGIEAARRHEAKRWLAAADEDLRAVELCLAGDAPALASAAFHCQQAVEKLLKAALTGAGIPFRRTHDLIELMSAVSPRFSWIESEFGDLRALSPWSLAYRYPSAEDDVERPPDSGKIRSCLVRIEALSRKLVASWIT